MRHPPDVPAAVPGPAPAPDRADVALVVVHGIGEQARGRTLLSWGEPLARRLHVLARERGGAGCRVARSHLTEGSEPTEFDLVVDLGAESCRIHVSEARWAEAFLTVGAAEVLSWGRTFLVRVANRFVRHALRVRHTVLPALDEVSEQIALVKLPLGLAGFATQFQATARLLLLLATPALALAGALVVALAAVLVAVVLALTVVLAVAAKVPFVKTRLRGLLTALISSVGDATAWTTHPVLAAAMRDVVLAEVQRAEARAERVVLLGHSQGAAVCADALLAGPVGATVPPVDVLVTVGAAVRLLGSPVWAGDDNPDGRPVERWSQLPALSWVNIWAGWDPVPSGPVADTSHGSEQRWRECYDRSLAVLRRVTDELRRRAAAPPAGGVLGTAAPAPRAAEAFTTAGPAEWPVHNRGSVIADHTTYTENVPQVIDPLARLLLRQACPGLELPALDDDIQRAHVTAVRTFAAGRLAAAASALCGVLAVGRAGIELPVLRWLTSAVEPLDKTAFGGLTWLGDQSWQARGQLVLVWLIGTVVLQAVLGTLWRRWSAAVAWDASGPARAVPGAAFFAAFAAAVCWPAAYVGWSLTTATGEIFFGVAAALVLAGTALSLPLVGLRPTELPERRSA
jgi:hypothetical protein